MIATRKTSTRKLDDFQVFLLAWLFGFPALCVLEGPAVACLVTSAAFYLGGVARLVATIKWGP